MEKFNHIFISPKDFDKSFTFYNDNLGWNVVNSWGKDGEPRGAILKSDGGMTVIIAEEHEDKSDMAWEEGKGFNGSRPTVHLSCRSVDQRFGTLKDKDSVTVKPEDNHWGSRWMVVKDPDDNLVAFYTPQESKQ